MPPALPSESELESGDQPYGREEDETKVDTEKEDEEEEEEEKKEGKEDDNNTSTPIPVLLARPSAVMTKLAIKPSIRNPITRPGRVTNL